MILLETSERVILMLTWTHFDTIHNVSFITYNCCYSRLKHCMKNWSAKNENTSYFMMWRLKDDYDDPFKWKILEAKQLAIVKWLWWCADLKMQCFEWLWDINNNHYTAFPYQRCKHIHSWEIKANILFASLISYRTAGT